MLQWLSVYMTDHLWLDGATDVSLQPIYTSVNSLLAKTFTFLFILLWSVLTKSHVHQQETRQTNKHIFHMVCSPNRKAHTTVFLLTAAVWQKHSITPAACTPFITYPVFNKRRVARKLSHRFFRTDGATTKEELFQFMTKNETETKSFTGLILSFTPDSGSPSVEQSHHFQGKTLAQLCHCEDLWEEGGEEEGWTLEDRLPRSRAPSMTPSEKRKIPLSVCRKNKLVVFISLDKKVHVQFLNLKREKEEQNREEALACRDVSPLMYLAPSLTAR